MPPKYFCNNCNSSRAALKRPRDGSLLCRECFFTLFETEIHEVILREQLFTEGDVVACGASGGKDSTVLIHILNELNNRYKYGVRIELISIDEGIVGYRDDSLETVKRNSSNYHLPLHILSYKELFGWTMDEIVQAVGLKNNCTYCGVFRRQALERGAVLVGANKIATGHNADDTAETILMNFLRGDAPRLARCTNNNSCSENQNYENNNIALIEPNKMKQFDNSKNLMEGLETHEELSPIQYKKAESQPNTNICNSDNNNIKIGNSSSNNINNNGDDEEGVLPRVKPLKYAYEKEIVLYAHFKQLDYFTTECTYAQEAFRGVARQLLKELERLQPRCIGDIIYSAEHMHVSKLGATPAHAAMPCERCGHVTSQRLCRTCVLLASLQRNNCK